MSGSQEPSSDVFSLFSQYNLSETTRSWTTSNEAFLSDISSANDFRRLSVLVWRYCSPVLLLVGGFGNVAAIFVLRRIRKKGGNSTQPVFLMALALSDLLLLYAALFFDMFQYGYGTDLRNYHSIPCKLLIWIMMASWTNSAWLLVTVTLQRALAVTWPHRVHTVFTSRRSSIATCLVSLASYGLHSHAVYGMDVSEEDHDGRCTAKDNYAHFVFFTWVWVDVFLSSIVPSVILLFCNMVLVFSLRRSARDASDLTSGNSASDVRLKVASSQTATVFLLSLAFLIFTLPLYVYMIWSHFAMDVLMEDVGVSARAELVYAVTSMMWFTNSTINFLLYCVSGTKFRREFLAWLSCGQ
ncbi:hypothetical protein BaRGS_00010984 [Batillaria attramentaria]|uniref:G-protein coupled receptors family 1 profile domain-containing protein n=1 Tax=Batillaria attramentaria TaxID=370345 RepID=A0ABD0LEP9_9CAEN|nr:hypothetical protein BaRGS_000014 [Batillaria attramentaria]